MVRLDQGGYSKQILKFDSKVIAIDRDSLSKDYAKKIKKSNILEIFFLELKSFQI